MNTPLFGLTLLLTACDWAATAFCWQRARWVTKPGALAALLAWFTFSGGWSGPLAWFGGGLVFSLVGDILLMLPSRYFPLGGASFFLTHVMYLAGFLQGFSPSAAGGVFFGATPLASVGTVGAIDHRHRKKALALVGMSSYALIILLMTTGAISTLWQPSWKTRAAVLVTVGAALFLISDAVLATNRFLRHSQSRIGDLVVMISYHTGQILLAAGALENFSAGA